MLTLLLLLAAPPQFTVVNRCPPVFTVVNKTPAAPVVAAPQPFRSGSYHSGHACPQCGRVQYSIASGSKYGPHTHACSACGTVWTH